MGSSAGNTVWLAVSSIRLLFLSSSGSWENVAVAGYKGLHERCMKACANQIRSLIIVLLKVQASRGEPHQAHEVGEQHVTHSLSHLSSLRNLQPIFDTRHLKELVKIWVLLCSCVRRRATQIDLPRSTACVRPKSREFSGRLQGSRNGTVECNSKMSVA